MENCYGVGVKNRYELFYDEEVDPLEILRQKEVEKEKRKTDKVSSTEKSKNLKSNKNAQTGSGFNKIKNVPSTATQKPADNSATIPDPKKVRNKPLIDRNARPRSFEGSNEDEKKNFRYREENGFPRAEYKERDGEIRRGRGGFRGRGRGRGRGSFDNNRPPRRDFTPQNGNERLFRSHDKREVDAPKSPGDSKDNSSVSGNAAESSTWMDEVPDKNEKCDSNWGETPAENGDVPESNIEKNADASDEVTESKETVPDESSPGAKEMTFDEWKQQQQSKRAVPKYNLRKPGEGEDAKQWKKVYILKKKVTSDGDEEEDDDEDDEDESTRRGRQRLLVDIQINFNDSRRSRGRGRGGGSFTPRGFRGSFAPRGERGSFAPRGERGSLPPRGGSFAPRGERGSFSAKDEREEWGTFNGAGVGQSYRGGGYRGMRIKSGQQSAPRVDDWNDFPSLVTD